MKHITLCIAFVLAAFALAPTVYVNTASAQEAQAETSTVTLKIKGMVSNNCPVLVETALAKVDGVTEVEASLESKTAKVEYDPEATSVAEIRKVIKDQVGFASEVAD